MPSAAVSIKISSLSPVTSHVATKVSSDPAGAVPVRPTHVSSSAAVIVPSLSFKSIVMVSDGGPPRSSVNETEAVGSDTFPSLSVAVAVKLYTPLAGCSASSVVIAQTPASFATAV